MSLSLVGVGRGVNECDPLREKVQNAQHPGKALVQLVIDGLKILQVHLLAEGRLVKSRNEIRIEEPVVEYGQAEHTSDELEVLEVFRVHARGRVNLEGIIVVGRVLEQAVARVEHFVGEKEEPFARDATIIERVLALKLDHQSLAQVLRPETHDGREAVLEHPSAAHAHVAFGIGDQPHRGLAAEVDDLAPVVAFVLRCVGVDGRGQPGIVPRGRAGVVVDKVDAPRRGHTHLPSRGQRAECGSVRERRRRGCGRSCRGPAWVVPGRRAGVVVDKIWAAVSSATFLPTEGQAHVGVGAIGIGRIGGKDLLGSLDGGRGRCRGRGGRGDGGGSVRGWASPGGGAGVMVDKVWTPALIKAELPARWKVLRSGHRLCYRYRGGTGCGDGRSCWLRGLMLLIGERIGVVGALQSWGFGGALWQGSKGV